MTSSHIPGLELREPLRSRPAYGGFLGGLTGAFFGLMSGGKAFPASWESQALGYCLGGLVVGVIVGALLPSFRRRWLAGVIVSVAATAGFLVASPFWNEDWPVELAAFTGAALGFAYAVLFWEYEPVLREDGTAEKQNAPQDR